MNLILASKSPRRIEIMKELGFDFKVVPSNCDEFVDSYSSNEDLVMALAKKKGDSVFKDYPDDLILSFDTLVFLGDEVLGKPQNYEDCVRMLQSLENKKHLVITGAYIKAKDYEDLFFSECFVHIDHIEKEDIEAYAKTEEPYDKAGGYAVQGFIGRYIDRVDGDFFSVIGLPKAMVYKKVTDYLKKKC
jgi:septum formation protein